MALGMKNQITGRQASADKIDITPEMIEVGVRVLRVFEESDEWRRSVWVTEIYRAMRSAGPAQSER